MYAWQFILPTKRVEFYLRLLEVKKLENRDVETKGLTGSINDKIQFKDKEMVRVSYTPPDGEKRYKGKVK